MRASQSLAALALVGLLACAQLGATAGRRLMNPIHDESTEITGPGTPKVKVAVAHAPASVDSSLSVRSEKPYATVSHSVPGAVIAATGETDIDTVQGPSFKSGKGKGGVTMRFDSGKRVFEVNRASTVTANFAATAVEVGGGQPLAIKHSHTVTGPVPNTTVAVTAGDGPSGRHTWALNLGPGMGRRL